MRFIFAFVGIVIIAFFVIGFGTFCVKEYNFAKLPMVEQESILLSHDFMPSTQQMHVAPIIGANGKMSTAVYSTGHSEKKITVWHCGEFGRLATENKNVYRFGKEKSTLYIRSNSYDTRIVGIKG